LGDLVGEKGGTNKDIPERGNALSPLRENEGMRRVKRGFYFVTCLEKNKRR